MFVAWKMFKDMDRKGHVHHFNNIYNYIHVVSSKTQILHNFLNGVTNLARCLVPITVEYWNG